jgi:hypothetical protein
MSSMTEMPSTMYTELLDKLPHELQDFISGLNPVHVSYFATFMSAASIGYFLYVARKVKA